MRPSEVLKRGEDYLERHGVDSPRADAETLMMSVLGVDRAGTYSRSEPLTSVEARSFGRGLCQRCSGVPLQHLTGDQQFRHLSLEVHPGVFIPRPETEVLAEVALEKLAHLSHPPVVVDVGTGTGAVALSVKHELPQATVYATDISSEAVWLASRNAQRLGLDVEVHEGDLFSPIPAELAGRVDVVVSNPPYVTAEEYGDLPAEVKADPEQALVGGTAVHARLAEETVLWLRQGGWLVVEIGESQGDEVVALFSERFADVKVTPDLVGRDRIVSGRLA